MAYKSSEGWSSDLESKPGITIFKAAVLVTIGIVIIVALVWGLRTGGSYWWGRGGAIQDKNSSANFEQAQALFHRDYTAVQADRVKIQAAQRDLDAWNAAHPGYQGNGTPFDPLAQQQANKQATLTGLQQGCLGEVSDYDTAAQAYLTRDFRDTGLPASLDVTTACDPAQPLPPPVGPDGG